MCIPIVFQWLDLMKGDFGRLEKIIDGYESEMTEMMLKMIAIRSVSPTAGGEGEGKRAEFLKKVLEEWGFAAKKYEYKDGSGVVRPNLVTKFGNGERTIWLVAHIDTVSEGDRSLWKTDPFVAQIANGKIYGRGACDNGQEVIAGMFAAKSLMDSRIAIKYNVGLALVADEEVGSTYGIQKLLKEDIFKKNDMFIVPDWGNERGDAIEVAEKGIVWLKISVKGKQAHASRPHEGRNAYRYSVRFLKFVDDYLHEKYNKKNSMFSPEASTFEMTKHEKNVDSVNIIPGTEVSYIDCRVLPEYKIDDVIKDVEMIAAEEEFKEVKIDVEVAVRNDASKPTDKNAEVVRMLDEALKDVRGISPQVLGIGGGTCAAFFRQYGLDAAVWSTEEDVAHQPNEFMAIKNMVDDAKVLAYLYLP